MKNLYQNAFTILKREKIPFMVGGTYAFTFYTSIDRSTKDLDLFCKAGDYPRILNAFSKARYKTEIRDERWLAKISQGDDFIDIIFGSFSSIMPVDDSWLEHARLMSLFGAKVLALPPEELIWSKAFRQERTKFDGADVNHIILKQGETLDWKRLLMRMEQHWEIFLVNILSFRYVYPSERHIIPKWLINELLSRLNHQLDLRSPTDKVCRGPLLSRKQYLVDINEWGFKSIQ